MEWHRRSFVDFEYLDLLVRALTEDTAKDMK